MAHALVIINSSILSLAFVFFFLHERGQPKMIALYLLTLISLLGLPHTWHRLLALWRSNPVAMLLIALFSAYLAGLGLLSGDGTEALKIAAKSVTWLAFLYAIALIATSKKASIYTSIVMICAAAVSAALSLQLDISLDYQPLLEDRLYALGHNANPVAVGISYSAALIATIMLIISWPSRQMLLLIIPAMVIFTALVRTQTVSAFIGLGSGLAVLCLTWLPPTWFRLAVTGGLGAFFLLLVTVVTNMVDATPLLDLLPRGASFRPEIWAATVALVADHNLFFGMGTAASSELNLSFQFDHPHSIYVSTFFYSGLTGFAILLGILMVTLISALSLPRHLQRICLPLLIMGIVALAFDGNRPIGNMSFVWLSLWLPIGLTLGLAANQHRINEPA